MSDVRGLVVDGHMDVQVHFESIILPVVNEVTFLTLVAMLFGGVRSRKATDAGGVSFISDHYLRVPVLSEFKRQLGIVVLDTFRKLGGGLDGDALGDVDVRVFVTPDSSTDSFAETTWRVISFVIASALPVPAPRVTISLGADESSKY